MENQQTPTLSIVVPCYNEEEMIEETITTLNNLVQFLVDKGKVNPDSFVVFVDDGSTDRTFPLLVRHKKENNTVLKLSSNCGHQYALIAGLDFVTGKADCAISIDADLQDDLTVIEKMIDLYTNGAHIVCGVRQDRSTDNWFKLYTARMFYLLMHKMGVNLIENHADFRLLSHQALTEISKYRETNFFLRGILMRINLGVKKVYYTQKNRTKGTTKYNLKKMLSLALSAITSFSIIPIRVVTTVGACVFVVSILLGIHVVYVYAKGDVVPGWASISLPLYFLGGIQLLSLGVIGEYIGKIYKETKQRPKYHIERLVEHVGIKSNLTVISSEC